MPTTQRRFVLSSVGASAASQASRPMAAQVLARLRSNSGTVDELVSALSMPAMTLFSHELDSGEWDDLLGRDALSAARVYARHPEVALTMDQLVNTHQRFTFLQLVAASTVEGTGAIAALNLLGTFDDDALSEYEALVAADVELPSPADIYVIAPLERVAELGHDIPADLTPARVMELIASAAEQDADELAFDTSGMTLSEVFDALATTLRLFAQSLEDGALPDPRITAALHRMALKVEFDAATLGAHDRASLEKLTELANAPRVDPGRWWLLRLAAAKGPNELAEYLSDLSELANLAAWEQIHPKDGALAGMLELIDLAAAQRAGDSVDVSRLLAAQAAAPTGLRGLENLVFAAGTGLVTVPAVDDEGAYVDGSAPGPAAPAQLERKAQDEPQDDLDVDDQVESPVEDQTDASEGDPEVDDEADAGDEVDLKGDPEAGATTSAHDREPRDQIAGAEGDTADADAEPRPAGEEEPDDSPDPHGVGTPAESNPVIDVALPAALARYITSPAEETVPTQPDAAPTDELTEPEGETSTGEVRPSQEPLDAELIWATPQSIKTQGQLVAQGRYGVAAHLAEALGAAPVSVGARRLSGYADALGNPTGVMAAEFSQLAGSMNREALGDDRIGQLLAWSAAAKVALLAPSAGPADVLVNMTPCVSASPALEEVSTALVEAARSGVVVVAPEVLAAAGANSAAHSRAEELSQRANDLATRAKHRTLKYLPAGDVYNAWLAPEGALSFVIGAVRANDREQSGAVGREIVEKLRGRAETSTASSPHSTRDATARAASWPSPASSSCPAGTRSSTWQQNGSPSARRSPHSRELRPRVRGTPAP